MAAKTQRVVWPGEERRRIRKIVGKFCVFYFIFLIRFIRVIAEYCRYNYYHNKPNVYVIRYYSYFMIIGVTREGREADGRDGSSTI